MSAEKDITLDEKRVYGATDDSTPVFVACEVGLARVEVSDDLVGEFSLARRGATADVVGSDGRLAVAGEDALVGTGDDFAETGFGPASAVGFCNGLVATGSGRVARYEDDAWTTLSSVEDVRTVAGETLAAGGGVFRLDGTHLGLDDARDLSAGDELFAATADGLYYLGNGWMKALDGGFRAVAADGDRVYAAAADGTLYARDGDDWADTDAPGDVADVTLADGAVYAVTADGAFLADVGDGWRERQLGLPGVRRLAVP